MSPAAGFCLFTTGALIPHATSSLQAGGHACRQPAATVARLGACASTLHRGQPYPRDGKCLEGMTVGTWTGSRAGAGTETGTGAEMKKVTETIMERGGKGSENSEIHGIMIEAD